MPWQERDWAKWTAEERDRYLGAGPSLRGSSSDQGVPTLEAVGSRANPLLMTGGVILVLLCAIGGWVLLAHRTSSLHEVAHQLSRLRQTSVPAPSLPAPAADTVRIRWSPQDVAVAASSGRICVDDHTLGRLCAAYAAGERPADVLTARVRELGLKVESG
jgi:hypothetical protein